MNLRKTAIGAFAALSLILTAGQSLAAPAVEVLGGDFSFPNRIEGLPAKLSDFPALQINSFTTDDGVRLNYWEAGEGRPLIFIPGWAANGAEYINVMFLLSQHYHVYVLDQRNQGLSQNVEYGSRVSRLAMDVKELVNHLGIVNADYCGWSMGASVLWSYIDLFGTRGIRKVAFIDEAPSIYSHADWSEQERQDAGGTVSSPERMIEALRTGKMPSRLVADLNAFERFQLLDSPAFQNSEGFARAVIRNDAAAMSQVMFDHVTNDWRDVIRHRINVPTAIFTGEYSPYTQSQRWMASVIPNSTLHVYTREEQGDHFLMFKNPFKFTSDLRAFLER